MAKPHEKLAESLAVLKGLQEDARGDAGPSVYVARSTPPFDGIA
ncbi:MAG: hypothetical protein R3E51_07310 [Rhizobiaceae bacterium]